MPTVEIPLPPYSRITPLMDQKGGSNGIVCEFANRAIEFRGLVREDCQRCPIFCQYLKATFCQLDSDRTSILCGRNPQVMRAITASTGDPRRDDAFLGDF